MKVVKSRILGYCHGVAETLKKANLCIRKGKSEGRPFYSVGELIHNKDVINTMEKQGLKVIHSTKEIPGIALVRAHGIPDTLRSEFVASGFELVDATCVNIKKSKEVIKQADSQGRLVIVVGVKNHAETNCLIDSDRVSCRLVSDENDLSCLFSETLQTMPVTVVVQTTFPALLYEELSEKISNYFSDCVLGNRLCPECICRKQCLSELSGSCEAIVVVGGLNSQNTKDLAFYAENLGKPVFQVENVNDFDRGLTEKIRKYSCIGICSGTSTPMEVINSVCTYLEKL